MPNYGYELIDPRDDLPFYVGITLYPEVRLQQHLSLRSANPKKNARIQDIRDAGLEPIQRIIFEVEEREVAERMEQERISDHLLAGISLTNHVHVPSLSVVLPRGVSVPALPYSEWITNTKDYGDACYPHELLAHPDYLTDLCRDITIRQAELEKGRQLTPDELHAEVEWFLITAPLGFPGRDSDAIIKNWYQKQFEKGGLLEGCTPA